ncbi:MAG: thiamine diphosphokinase [Candidatus Limnocylindrales bacterium]
MGTTSDLDLAAGGRHALVVADGDVPVRAALDAAWPGWDAGVADIIAADGGLARARTLGLRPDSLVGDLDSLDPALLAAVEAEGLPVKRARTDKDESDAELALLEAVARGATRITVLGAFGGPRLDHALANLWLLAHPALATAAIILLDAGSRAFLVQAPGADGEAVTRPLPGPDGATITLLPFGGDAVGITTRGLAYPLRDEPLTVGPARGLSNVRTSADAAVTIRAGRLLVVETAHRRGRLSSGS